MNETTTKKGMPKGLKIALSVIVGLWLLTHWTWIAAIFVVVGLMIAPTVGLILVCALIGALFS